MSSAEVWQYMKDRIGFEYCYSVDYGFNPHYLPRLPPDYYIEVPCGKCVKCKQNRRLGWSLRLIQEIQCSHSSSFVTLTLDDKWLPIVSKSPKAYIKLYIDRLRKTIGKRPRYFIISELGDEKHHTGRLHFHCIFFGTDKKLFSYKVQRDKWPYGNVWCGNVNFRTANYLTKYMLKDKNGYKPILMCSNGIGASYVNAKSIRYHINNFDFKLYLSVGSSKYPLPQYYQRKMFSEDVMLVKMLNFRLNPPTEWHLGSRVFTNYREYLDCRDWQYRESLRLGLSNKVNFKDYGKLCNSESEAEKLSFFVPRPFEFKSI